MQSLMWKVLGLMLMVSLAAEKSFAADAAILVEGGQARASIIVAKDAPSYNQKAAQMLQDYLQKISGAQVPIENTMDNAQGVRIWIGAHPQQADLIKREPRVGATLTKTDETIQFADAQDVVIRGRDRVDGKDQIEVGTYLATQRFIIEQLRVRWLWPGDLGTDVPKQSTVTIEPFFKQYAPQIVYRRIRGVEYEYRWKNKFPLPGAKDSLTEVRKLDVGVREWLNHHSIEGRLNGTRNGATETPIIGNTSITSASGHYFSHWYDLYYKDHPEWFALQPDGTRGTYPLPHFRAKICVSNPGVLEQYLKEATTKLQRNPRLNVVGIAPNDNGWAGYCVCDNCKAWDAANSPLPERPLNYANGVELKTPAITDRLVRFWNMAAKELKVRFPDRDVHLLSYAYNAYRTPPVATKLEDNIIIQFEGIIMRHRFQNSDENMAEMKEMWKGWANQAAMLMWRPNFRLNEPGDTYTMLRRFGETMNFLADHKIAGIDIDNMVNYWSTQGPQYYLSAVMTWDPHANADQIMTDYYARAYGPAAEPIRAYYKLTEELYYYMAQNYERWTPRKHVAALYRELRIPPNPPADTMKYLGISPDELKPGSRPIETRTRAYLDQARKLVANADPVYRKRVEFVAIGQEFVTAHLDVVEAMQLLKASPKDVTLQKKANEAYERQQKILAENTLNFALNYMDATMYALEDEKDLIPPDMRTLATVKEDNRDE